MIQTLLKAIHAKGGVPVPGSNALFRAHSVELFDSCGNLVAGEVGYSIGRTFTSLTGFFDAKSKNPQGRLVHSSAGKIQLILLAEALRDRGFAFWNLGHPPRPRSGSMMYKADIGGTVISRKEFLERWVQARDMEPKQSLGQS
eukprot:c18885_g1_i5.p1 GENE.c18885_g1_i5~~c18885_g1_i5.p1  ORF type:complete len:143 (+),score=14.57 c18885_g1_i5:426-854(+)